MVGPLRSGKQNNNESPLNDEDIDITNQLSAIDHLIQPLQINIKAINIAFQEIRVIFENKFNAQKRHINNLLTRMSILISTLLSPTREKLMMKSSILGKLIC